MLVKHKKTRYKSSPIHRLKGRSPNIIVIALLNPYSASNSSFFCAVIASLFLSISLCFSSFSIFSFSTACFVILTFLACSSYIHWASTRSSASCFTSTNLYLATVAVQCCTSPPRSSACSCFKPVKWPSFPWEMSVSDAVRDHNHLLKGHPFIHTIAGQVTNQDDLLVSSWAGLESGWRLWWHNPGPRTLDDWGIWRVK